MTGKRVNFQLLFSAVSNIVVSSGFVTVVFAVAAVLQLRRTLGLGGLYVCFVCWSSRLQIPAGMHLWLIQILGGLIYQPPPFAPKRAGIATRYGADGPGIGEWGEFSAPVQTGPGVNPAFYTMGTGPFPAVERRDVAVTTTTTPPPSARVKERVKQYLYSSGISWPVLRWICTFSGAFARFPTATISVMSARPPVRMEQFCSHWTNFRQIWYLYIFRKSVEKTQVSLKSDNNNRYFTWRPVYIFYQISPSSS
jgi:hypothetical protein